MMVEKYNDDFEGAKASTIKTMNQYEMAFPSTKSQHHIAFIIVMILCIIPLTAGVVCGLEYTLSGGPQPSNNVKVDDDLTVYVNGNIKFIDDDHTWTIDPNARWKGTPIKFEARPGDKLRIVAKNTHGHYDLWLFRSPNPVELSELYIYVDGNSVKLTNGVSHSDYADDSVFFDETYTLPGTLFGSISISSTPSGASIYLDGTYKGTTPKTISDVSPGSHTIKLEKTGYNDITKTIDISTGRAVSVSETLILKTGSISVSSTPSGASVYLDGTYKGTIPKTIRSVPIGSHTVRISKEGYHDETKSVRVEQDRTTSVSVHLTLQTGSIDIFGPDGASVYLDDVYKGTAPTTISNIPVGTYKITVEKFGYTTWRQTMNVRSRSTVTVTPDMVFLPMVTYNGVPLGAIAIICIALILLAFVWLFRWRERKKSAQQTASARKSESEPKTNTSAPLSPSSEPTLPEQTSPPEPEPISPSNFTPRPTTPSTFPPELANLYSDPVYAGKGGFARVFRAKRNTDNKTVAVKIPISLDEGTGRSFLREITSWQRLNHENIITLYDANILPIPYLEIEYADAGSLDQMNKPVDVDTASEIILRIADGLAYSHAQGVIHRDLKPMNVLLTEDFTPKISDWGLSKIIAESKTTSIYGFSPLYGSPEQISPKKFGKPDERTDIYQLGIIFYELSTGRTPFEGDDLVEVSTAIVTEEPVPPSSISPEAKIVDHIILKCLAKKKENRYQNVRELQKDLASALKTQLKESLRMSVSEQNIKRSAFYCAEICLVHARLGEIDDVAMYLTDMQNYASEEVKTEVTELLEELERRKDMSSEEKISEEFVGRLKGVLHQVRMGR